jgi:hypothetical protein
VQTTSETAVGGLPMLFIVGGVIEEGAPTSGMKDPGAMP